MFFLGNILGCIFWGAVIAVAATAAVWLICRLISGNLNSLGACIVLTVLFILAGAQGSMITGAFYLRGYVDEAHDAVAALVPTIETGNLEQASANIDEIKKRVFEEYPMLEPFADKIDLSQIESYAQSGTAMADTVAKQFNDSLAYYILRRVLWLLGFMIVATLAIVFLFSYRGGSSDYSDYGGTGLTSGGGAGSLQF